MLLFECAGFARLYKISEQQVATIVFVCAFGFTLCTCYAYSKLLSSMADSNLFPKFLSTRTASANLPLNAICLGQLIAFVLSVIGLLCPSVTVSWPSIVGLFTFFTYIIQLVGFFSLRLKLDRFPREFSSPFGIIGGIYALVIFTIGTVTCIIDSYYSVVVVFVYLAMMSLYYQFKARHQQTFSNAEKLVMLPVHVEIKNANGERNSEFVVNCRR
jgi:amino acid transporter